MKTIEQAFLKRAAVFFFLFFSFYTSAFAIDLPGVDKAKIRLSIAPGKASHGEITVENSTPETKSLQVYLGDWYYLSAADGSKEFVPVNTLPSSCASWISFSPAELTLAPFSKQKVNYSVKVPAAASGGHYATIFFEGIFGKFETANANMQATMNIAIRIATLFYIEVEGTMKRSARVENLTVKKEKDQDSYLVQLDFTNTGNADITAGGTCHVMDKEGMIYARGEFKNVYTFSNDKARLECLLKGKVPAGRYDLVLTIDLGKALQEDNYGSGPLITKEAEIEFGPQAEIVRVKEKL